MKSHHVEWHGWHGWPIPFRNWTWQNAQSSDQVWWSRWEIFQKKGLMSWSIFSSPEQINTGDNWKATQKDYSISHCNQESIVSTCMPSVRVQPSSWQEMLIDKTKYLYKLVIYLSRKEGGLTNVKIVIFRGQCPLNWFHSHLVVRSLGIWLTMQLILIITICTFSKNVLQFYMATTERMWDTFHWFNLQFYP